MKWYDDARFRPNTGSPQTKKVRDGCHPATHSSLHPITAPARSRDNAPAAQLAPPKLVGTASAFMCALIEVFTRCMRKLSDLSNGFIALPIPSN